MECIVVQDLFLNETAKYAHVFLPGSSFLEKDGTFTNAERRISRVRKVMPSKSGKSDWEVTVALAAALGYPMPYTHPSQIMDEIAALTPSFHGVSYDKLERLGSIQWPCNEQAPEGTPIMHIGSFIRGKGKFINTQYFATDEKVTQRYPLILTTGRMMPKTGACGKVIGLVLNHAPVRQYCVRRSLSGYSLAWYIPPSTFRSRVPMSLLPITQTGRPIVRNTR